MLSSRTCAVTTSLYCYEETKYNCKLIYHGNHNDIWNHRCMHLRDNNENRHGRKISIITASTKSQHFWAQPINIRNLFATYLASKCAGLYWCIDELWIANSESLKHLISPLRKKCHQEKENKSAALMPFSIILCLTSLLQKTQEIQLFCIAFFNPNIWFLN